ncbi:hypothetical protein FQR65_LT09109 [Abscondita terminalis]|nr:hypothetical protein FQR65_LT09109 [Abscondita terminalis]
MQSAIKFPETIMPIALYIGTNCMLGIENGTTEFGSITPDEALVGANFLKNVVVVGEFRPESSLDEDYEFATVVLVRKSAEITVQNLRNKKYCHPGFRFDYGAYMLKEFENYALKENSAEGCSNKVQSETLLEKEIKALADFFGPSCRPGPWVDFEQYDSFYSSYSKLCELCPNKTCKGTTSSFMQSIECLVNGGDVALTTLHKVYEYFNKSDNAIKITEYEFLCPNGTKADFSSPCTWSKQPWHMIIANTNSDTKTRSILDTWFGDSSSSGALITSLKSILFPRGESMRIKYFDRSLTLHEHLKNYGVVPTPYEKCNENVKWCTVSTAEQKKCEWLSQAAANIALQPSIKCVQSPNKFACLEDIKTGIVDVVAADAHFGYVSRKKHLVPLAYPDTSVSNRIKPVILIKANDNSITKLEHLKDKKSCFPEYGGIEWLSFINYARHNNILPTTSCDYGKLISDFVGDSCMPGAHDAEHEASTETDKEKLCRQCQADPYLSKTGNNCNSNAGNRFYGNAGALICLKEAGDFAVVSAESTPKSEDFKVLCRNGSVVPYDITKLDDNCVLTVIVDSEVLSKNHSLKNPNIQVVLLHLEFRFGSSLNKPFEVFNIFNNTLDLLFKDSTQGLTRVDSDKKQIQNFVNVLADHENCVKIDDNLDNSRQSTKTSDVAEAACGCTARPTSSVNPHNLDTTTTRSAINTPVGEKKEESGGRFRLGLVAPKDEREQDATSHRHTPTLPVYTFKWHVKSTSELDLEYLCNKNNAKEIANNVDVRKGIGDINLVHELKKTLDNTSPGSIEYSNVKKQLLEELLKMPNRTHPSVSDLEHEPRVVTTVGKPKEFSFNPREFYEITKRLHLVRTDQLGNVVGNRCYYLMGDMALLEQALIKYTVSKLLEQSFQLISVPDILHRDIIEGCGLNTTGGRTQVYTLDNVKHGEDLCLSGTSEMSLASLYINKVLAEKDLPIKLAAVSRCYRAEASSISDERGIYRVHQFTKVEMFAISKSEDSDNVLEEFRTIEENNFASLGLHFKTLDMPPHELGAPAYRKYDIEAWLPGRNIFGEISSCSNCTDYQSRRLNIKYRQGDVLKYAHTLNGTACAIPRMLIAITETFQTDKGVIEIPEVLQKYMYDKTHINTYFLNIFNESTGLLHFLKEILYKPEYKKVKLGCFELLYTIVNNFCKKIEKHLLHIINTCAPVVRSSASAIEKEKSLIVLSLILQKGNLYASDSENVENEIKLLYKDTLFNCLCNRFDKSVTVQEHLLIAIGLVAKKFPTVINNYDKLCNNVVNQLNKELHSKDRSLPIITGCVSGLSNFLENFSFDLGNDKATLDKVYNCVKLLADPGDARKKVAYRENLSFLSKHVILFAPLMYIEAQWWHQTLLKWLLLGVEDKKAAYGTLESITQEIANILSTKDSDYDRELFKVDNNYEMQLAIRGLGFLAKSFKMHITPIEISGLFATISQILENNYILNSKIDPDQLMYLSHYVQTLSLIIRNLPELSSNHVVSLQLISILLIKLFPQLSTMQHHLVIDAFVIMLHQLTFCEHEVLESFLENVIYQGVLWTCSHHIVSDAELMKEANQELITHKNHLPFWHGLLNIITVVKYERFEIDMRDRKYIVKKLINQLLNTLFILLNKINLEIKLIDSNNPVTDPAAAFEPVQINDFTVFVNVVDFYQDIIENMNLEIFKLRIPNYINMMLKKSLKYPLVSGFYKLLASSLKNCEKLNYFEECNLENHDVKMCHLYLMKFTERLLQKMKQYKGDLQIACLQVMIAMPISIVQEVLPSISSAFLVLFSIGRSYLQLAHLGLDALEKWVKVIPANDFDPVLKKILPSLDSYLKSRSLGGNLESNLILKHRKTKQLLSKRKILVQTEPELLKLQIKILSFIGQLNNNLCMAFVNFEDQQSTVWRNTSYLKVIFPYNNKLSIYMERFVPRVLELSLLSSDRKMRIAACELLHAFVLIILGTSKPMDDVSRQNLDYLMKTVAFSVLKLACDIDEIVQQLFSSLTIQLMHYYSHPLQMGTSHTEIVIEALMDGVTNPTDSSLRDFSGKCIHEFVKWTIKQADRNDLSNNPTNIKIWIRNIQSFSVHTDPFKRLGAALIFNNMYTLLREETQIFNMFWLELLYAFVLNLSVGEANDLDDNCVEQVLQALSHIERGFVEKSQTFNKNDTKRRKPPDLGGVLLKDVAVWLLKETSSKNSNCRYKCMNMFCKIAPLVTGCNNSLEEFNKLHCNIDPEWIASSYEAELIKTPTLREVKDITSTHGLFKWIQSVLCALDGYIFVVNNNILPKNVVSQTSQFFMAIKYFFDNVLLNPINRVIELIPNSNIIYTNVDKEHFNCMKAKVINTLMDLLIAVTKNKKDLMYAKIENRFLWEHNLGNLLCYRIFDPILLGFDFMDDNKDVVNFLNTISCYVNESVLLSLNNNINSYIDRTSSKFTLSLASVSFKQRQLLKGLLLLHGTSLSNKLNFSSYKHDSVHTIKKELIENKHNKVYIKTIHKTAKEYCDLKLELALCDKNEVLNAIQFMLDKSLIINEKTGKEEQYGLYFYHSFKDVLLKCLAESYELVLDQVLANDTEEILFIYVFDILQYVSQNIKGLEHYVPTIVNASLGKWNRMIVHFNANSKSRMTGLEFIRKLAAVSITPLYDILRENIFVVEWLIGLLTYEEFEWTEENSLSFKSEVINVLPCVLGRNEVCSTELSNAFQYIKTKYYTGIKLEHKQISLKTTFKKLLDAVKYSKSLILLKAALDIYMTSAHINKDIDLSSTLKSFIRHLSIDQQINTLHVVYEMSFDTNQFVYSQRYILAKSAMPQLIQSCYYDAFANFFSCKIGNVIADVKKKTNTSVYDINEIVNKIINFIMIELLFFKINTDHFQNNSCSISKAAFPNDLPSDKKMLKFFTRIMLDTSKEVFTLGSQEHKDFYRIYQCYAYNALISLISNTQTSLEFYNSIFLREDLWSKIIDTDRKYVFEIDFDKIPEIRKVLINIRSEMRDEKKKIDPSAHTINYIESQHLFRSTLNEDITKFDFTHSVLRNERDESIKIENTEMVRELELTLEEVHINLHECMPSLCGVIQHMVDNDIHTLPTDGTNVLLPKWMKGLRKVLMDDNIKFNVKIFLVKVIHNCQHIFKYYAKFFYTPILKIITDEVLGSTINFFVSDLVVMLNSWSSIALPSEDRSLVSALLKFLMSTCDHDVRSIFKYNLELIRMVIENWKNCLEIPHEILLAKLQLPHESQKLDVGVHLTATILANNIAPWPQSELKNFLMTLAKILKNSHRNVYQPCSEVLGMALKFISQDPNSFRHLEGFKKFLYKQLDNISTDDNKFAYCLQGITLHYPIISDNYVVLLNSKLKLVQDTLHRERELQSIDFPFLLLEENSETQLLALEIVKKSISLFEMTQLKVVLKAVANFVNNSITPCRILMYEIFIIAYDNLFCNETKLAQEITASKSEEYSQKLFPYPLYNCDFTDYNLTINWRRQHASMAPLFAASLSSQDGSLNVMNPNVLRATVSTLEFQPTQVPSHSSTRFTSQATSLLISLGEDKESGDRTFKNPNLFLPGGSIRSRRILKDKSKVSRHFAQQEVKKSIKQEELRKERIQKSEKSVNLYRKYRIGEYPDIEIALSSVINPLQMLVLCDATLARYVYTSIFTSLVNKMKTGNTETIQFTESVKKYINNILSSSTEFAPNTIGTFLDITLTYKHEMQFEPIKIANASIESGLLSVGSLVLEEYLEMKTDEPTPAKRCRGVESADTNCWVKLAELYKEMNEWDVVTAIFMEKMNCSEIVLKAIEAESNNHWRAAQECYVKVIEEDTSQDRRDFYYESYFKCFAALGEWDNLARVIDDTVSASVNDNIWDILWDGGYNQNKLLPWYITAGLRNTLSGDNQNMFALINESLQNPQKSEYLKSNFGEQLAMLSLLQNDYDTANYYLNNTIKSWLQNWAHINPLFLKLRASTLFNLKGVVDVYLFINFINGLTRQNAKANVEVVLKSWTDSSTDFVESLLHSETTTVYRNQFISVIQQKLLTIMLEDDLTRMEQEFKDSQFKLHINLIERAYKQGNYYVARKYLKFLNSSKLKPNMPTENMQWTLALSTTLYLLSQTREKDEDKLNSLLDSWDHLEVQCDSSIVTDRGLCYMLKTKRHVCELSQKIRDILALNPELYNINQNKLKKLLNTSLLTGVDQVFEYGITDLKDSLVFCQNQIDMMMNNYDLEIYSHMAEAYVKLAYCVQEIENMDESFTMYVLRAMKLGSNEGKQLFPCLLNRNIAEFRNTFKSESSTIPIWMFLKWIPQLLANLDNSCVHAIDNIVLNLAKTYPQAMMFSYRISREKYNFEPGSIENVGRVLMQKLNELLLPGELVENFLKALASVSSPLNILSYYLKKLRACDTEESFKTLLQRSLDDIFPECQKNLNYKDPKSLKGPMFKDIYSYENKLNALLKGKFDLQAVKEKVSQMLENPFPKLRKSTRLVDYSPWLAYFQASELRETLEIPGQYTGEKRPLVQYHTKITGFSQSVFLLDSLRAPIRITILGNDAKEYHYLIKFGEDLRQDQRIEQIFTLMNNVLLQDGKCNKRQLHIATYQVVPLSCNLGIIEWLTDTMELLKFVQNGLDDKSIINKSVEVYNKWITRISLKSKNKNVSIPAQYCNAALTYKATDFISKYTEMVNSIDVNSLKKSFWNISLNSENFFAMRQKFIVSYAVICISHWLLGINDRHLKNTLISLRNGGAIGIDFGYAFGAGTQFLPIPELVPFRLTPHIINILQPLNEHGLLQETMIHCLRAFRRRSKILIATMNVFIQEPSIDWIDFARRSEIACNYAVSNSWYPQQKIEHVKRKFSGGNSVNIMIEELTAGHSQNPRWRDILIDAIKGAPNNIRSKFTDNLTEEEQVKCLLDHATDFNLLGRMYEGWCSWI